MKPHEHTQDQELQKNIEEQEQAMAQMLLRVMERPLTPLHKTIEELGTHLAAVQKASVHAAHGVEAGLREALEEQDKRLKRQFNDVADDVEKLEEALAKHASTLDQQHTGQAARDQHMQDTLASAFDGLVQQYAQVEDSFDKVATALEQLDAKTAAALEQLDAKTVAALHQLDAKAVATGASVAAVASTVGQIDTGLATQREQDLTIATRLSGGLASLSTQLERQQAALSARIDTVPPSMAPQFDLLSATMDKTSREVAERYSILSASQQALVTATVQEQLALQLAPFQAKSTFLLALCVLSFASTLALLGLHFYH